MIWSKLNQDLTSRSLFRGFPTKTVPFPSAHTDNHLDTIRCTAQGRKLFIMKLFGSSPHVLSTDSPDNHDSHSSLVSNKSPKVGEITVLYFYFNFLYLYVKGPIYIRVWLASPTRLGFQGAKLVRVWVAKLGVSSCVCGEINPSPATESSSPSRTREPDSYVYGPLKDQATKGTWREETRVGSFSDTERGGWNQIHPK
jgi:hypothetical protein